MHIFLAGIMQGSHLGALLHNQDYRDHLKGLLETHLPDAQVYDPLSDHRDSLAYDDATGRRVFFDHCRLCQEVDLVVAVIPEATMGTAIEMWQAHLSGRAVVTISPLVHNWVVKFLSDVVYEDIDQFEAALRCGEVARQLAQLNPAEKTGADDSQSVDTGRAAAKDATR